MNAVILAAGRGSRLGSLSDDAPKCLVRAGGKPLLEWQLAALRNAGIGELAVVAGYRAEQIPRAGVTVLHNARWRETNMVGSLRCAGDWLSSTPCVVSYADIIYSATVVRRLMTARGDLAVTYDVNWRSLWEARFDDPLSDAESFRLDSRGRIIEIGNRAASLDEIEGQYMGLLKFTPAGWRHVDSLLSDLGAAAVDRLDMTSLLQRVIASGLPVDAVPITEQWFEFDSRGDFELFEQRFGGTIA
jgi:L-glutamine-phosphate cytidylyltransferase